MRDKRTIDQRIKDFRALCAYHSFTVKKVTDEADLPYHSVIVNMRRGDISDERMTLLEETALRLRDRKKKVIAELA